MTIGYKIDPRIREFILQQKQFNANLSCRTLVPLIRQRFNLDVSKSSVNLVLRQVGLSNKVGRRRTSKNSSLKVDGAGAYFLKAADINLGLASLFLRLVKARFPKASNSLIQAKNHALVFGPAFGIREPQDLQVYEKQGLWIISGASKKLSGRSLLNYSKSLDNQAFLLNLLTEFDRRLVEVLCIGLVLNNGVKFYVDSQSRTMWKDPQKIPLQFCLTIDRTRASIEEIFFKGAPLWLNCILGYSLANEELLNLIYAFSQPIKFPILKLNLHGFDGKEIEGINLPQAKSRHFAIGVLPWQSHEARFLDLRRSEVSDTNFKGEEFQVISGRLELSHPITGAKFNLNAVLLKGPKDIQPRISIITNIAFDQLSPETISRRYLERWPNLEEGCEDILRKIEARSTTHINPLEQALRQRFLKSGIFDSRATLSQAMKILLHLLSYYVTKSYFTASYGNVGLEEMLSRVYGLDGLIEQDKNYTIVKLEVPSDSAWKKDLDYACRRVNEDNLILPAGQRMYFVTIEKTS